MGRGPDGREIPDVVEQAVIALRRNRDRLLELVPCTVTVHLPPPGSKNEVALDVSARLR